MRRYILSLLLLVGLGLGSGFRVSPALGAQQGAPDRQQVMRELDEAYRALQEYTYAKKDQFLRWAEARKKELDRQIAELQAQIDAAGDEAKTNLRAARADLEKERGILEERLKTLKQSGAEAWNDTKWGFSAAIDQVEQAYRRARSRFLDEQGKKQE